MVLVVLLGGRYEVGRPLGSGGMARVVAGHDLALDRPVAIKLIRDELVGDRTTRERLMREARGAAGLQHPNTVAVHDVGEHDGVPFIVMELIDGTTLAETLRSEGRLPADRTVAIVDGVLAGLAAAHDRGLVHRDVKPSNILLPSTGGVKLADFGIARELAAGAAHLTTTGQLLGTPRYAAPEQAAGRPATPASDVYSVGVVAYECLAGRPPFEADTPFGMAIAHEQEPVPPLDSAVPGLAEGFAEVVERALAKDPASRFDDAATMRQALRAAVGPGFGLAAEARRSRPAATELTPDTTRPTGAPEPIDTIRQAGVTRALTLDEANDTAAMPTDETQLMGDGRPRKRRRVLSASAIAAVVVGALALAAMNDDPAAVDDDARDAPTGNVGDADEALTVEDEEPLEAASDLDELIASLARDPDAAGAKGEDLFDDLRELRGETDAQQRRQAARELIIDIAQWIVDGELEADLGRDAIRILEVEGRPTSAQLADASALFANVASRLDDWGEAGDDLLDELDTLLDTSAPGRVAREARDLADDVERWIDEAKLDHELGSSALEVLRPLGRRG